MEQPQLNKVNMNKVKIRLNRKNKERCPCFKKKHSVKYYNNLLINH